VVADSQDFALIRRPMNLCGWC